MKNVPVLKNLKRQVAGVLIEQLENVVIAEKYSSQELTEPHKHDHYTCLYVEKGTIELLVDLQKITAGKNTLHILFPGQVHQFIKASPLTAFYLSFDVFLATEASRNVLEQSLAEIIIIKLTQSESEWFRSLLVLMTNSRNKSKGMDLSIHTLQTLAASFIVQAASLYQAREQRTNSIHSSNQINIAKKFIQFVRLEFKVLKRPSEYAELMNLSVSYLNDTVKKVTGFSMSHFIQRQITLEAQRLLYYSELNVKEIAISLGYEDYKYFNRLFAKVVGMPPGAFRNRLLVNKLLDAE